MDIASLIKVIVRILIIGLAIYNSIRLCKTAKKKQIWFKRTTLLSGLYVILLVLNIGIMEFIYPAQAHVSDMVMTVAAHGLYKPEIADAKYRPEELYLIYQQQREEFLQQARTGQFTEAAVPDNLDNAVDNLHSVEEAKTFMTQIIGAVTTMDAAEYQLLRMEQAAIHWVMVTMQYYYMLRAITIVAGSLLIILLIARFILFYHLYNNRSAQVPGDVQSEV